MVEILRAPPEGLLAPEIFEDSVAKSVTGRLGILGIRPASASIHPMRRSPLILEQDLSDSQTQVGYTVGAKTCTMLAVWGLAPRGKAVLAVLHHSGMEEAYGRLDAVGREFSARGASVRRVGYARGQLGHLFGVLDEGRLAEALREAASGGDFSVEYLPSKANPISWGLIAEARSGKMIPF